MKLGKIGKINLKARKKIAEIAEEKGIIRCELNFVPCMGAAHAPAHRHPRVWYRSQPELLWDFNQWVGACQNCHGLLDKMPKDKKEEIFIKLRGLLDTQS